MRNSFLRKMMAAGGLTRQGKLAEATLAIQRALLSGAPGGSARPAGPPSVRATDKGMKAGAGATVDAGVAASEVASDAAIVLEGLVREAEPAPARPVGGGEASVADPVETSGRFLGSSFTGGAGTRTFKLFAPAGFEGQSLPLVVMLHGCTQDPDDFAAGTRMNELAQAEGFFALYPAQAARSNSHKCWNWFSPADQRRGSGEPALLAGMVRHIQQTHPVDADRVYVAGLSAGGAMAAILANEYPDLFAAAGVHSGIATGAAHDVASAFSVMKSGPATA
ncbi:MAG: PHB depolymerase family esterase, partial [Caldimonas sp.]